MKKAFLILLTLLSLTPGLALADAGGAAITEDRCVSFNCHCTVPYPRPYIGTYASGNPGMPPDVKNLTTAEDCHDACLVMWYQVSPTGEGITSDFTCEETGTPTPEVEINEPIFPQLNVVVPGLGYMIKDGEPFWAEAEVKTINGVQYTNLLGTYIKAWYTYLLGAATIVAVTMLMIAGLQYATAGGNAKRVDQAKSRIANAVAGVILLLLAYNIAFLVNPATTTFNSLGLQNIKSIEVNDETPPNFSSPFAELEADGPPLMNQNDYPNDPYGPARCLTSTTGSIKSSGCGVVSFAMAASHLTGQTIDPRNVALSFYNNFEEPTYRPQNSQGCGENGTMNAAMYESPLIEELGLKARQIPISDKAQLRALLKKNKLIITSYRTSSGGGHYVVISGYTSDGRLIVSNPFGGARGAGTEEWWFSTIKSAAYIDTAEDFIPEGSTIE